MDHAAQRQADAQEDGLIRSGELIVDTNGYTANLRGIPIDLAYKEFELLKYLVQHPGRVFTRAQLLQEVWGYDRHSVFAFARSSRLSSSRIVCSGIFTKLAASIGSTRTRCDSSASDGNTVAGSGEVVIKVRSIACRCAAGERIGLRS